MPKRMIDTELWNDEDIIENFTAEDKYFWLYLLTNPHNSICGVFKNSPALMARDMGLHKDTIINLLYRFEHVHNLIKADRDTNEILILNWSKYNWTKSPKIVKLVEGEMANIKSQMIISLLAEKLEFIYNDEPVESVYKIPYQYPPNSNTNTNSIHNSISNIDNNVDNSNSIQIIDNTEINKYFDNCYVIYPRKGSKVQAKETFEHKLRGLEKEEAHIKAVKVYQMIQKQTVAWQQEHNGDGRKLEYIPLFSSWLNDNIENSPKFRRGRK